MRNSRHFLLKLNVSIPICLVVLNCTHACAQTVHEFERAGDKFENVSILNDMPADQMGKVMNIMSAALGVNCSYCHAGTDFAKENVPHKDVAREMLDMTLSINREHFGGKTIVTCHTCHRGQAQPDSTVSLVPMNFSAAQLQTPELSTAEKAPPKAEAQVILARYIAAIGGRERLEGIGTRHVAGHRLEPDGRTEPEELWQTAAGLSRMRTLYGDLAVIESYDGDTAWKQAAQTSIQLKPDEAEQVQTEVGVAFPTRLEEYYRELTATEPQWLEGRWLQVILATRRSGLEETLYFDNQTGFLVQRIASVPTLLGQFQHRVDYSDYKAIDGIQVPTTIRFAVPNISWTRKVSSVTFNPTLPEDHFRRP